MKLKRTNQTNIEAKLSARGMAEVARIAGRLRRLLAKEGAVAHLKIIAREFEYPGERAS